MKIENYSLEEKIKKETNSLGIKIKKEVEDNSYGDNIPMIVKTEPSEETKIKDVLNVKKIFEGKEPFLMQVTFFLYYYLLEYFYVLCNFLTNLLKYPPISREINKYSRSYIIGDLTLEL